MLSHDNSPGRDDAWLVSETAAAMRDLAGTVADVPPLRQPSEDPAGRPRGHASRSHTQRRWIRWAAPLAAAAAVVALAVSLVLVKGIQNDSAVPSNTTISTGQGGVPRYYVALQEFPEKKTGIEQNHIVVGDSLTGQTLATFAPPAHTTFWSVSAAADDRTFVIEALTPARPSEAPLLWPYRGAGTVIARWFEVRLAPGTTDPARLTPLPVRPQSWVSPNSAGYGPATAGVVSSAVSPSGRELAVLDVPASGREEVKVFSLATGQLLHDWTTDSPAVRVPIDWVTSTSPIQALTWIDAGQAVAFAAVTSAQVAPSTGDPSGTGTLRSLNVGGPVRGDLLADSTPIWSGDLPYTAPLTSCFAIGSWPEQISANGQTVSCAQGNASRIAFVTDPLTAGATATGTIDYQVKIAQGSDAGVLWTSPSGGTLIGVWGNGFTLGQSVSLDFGVISHGTFTPLRLPSSLTSDLNTVPYPIAF